MCRDCHFINLELEVADKQKTIEELHLKIIELETKVRVKDWVLSIDYKRAMNFENQLSEMRKHVCPHQCFKGYNL